MEVRPCYLPFAMPYSQIIALMLALLVIAGGNGNIEPAMPPGLMGFLWLLKTAIWTFFVYWLTKKKTARLHFHILGWIQWAPLMLLATDIYFLDLKTFLTKLIGASIPGLIEILALGFYISYLIITWAAYWLGLKRKGLQESPLSSEISMRLRFIAPAIVPYLIITLTSGLMVSTKWQWLNNFMESKEGDALSVAFVLIAAAVFIPLMIRIIWRCKPMPKGQERDLVEKYLEKTSLKYGEILLWPLGGARFCTAAVLGVIPRFRYILLTPCLMEHLMPEEIDAVLSHEVAHVKRGHIIWYIIFIGLFSLAIYRLSYPVWIWLLSHNSFIKAFISMENTSRSLASAAISLPFGILLILYFRFLMGYFMRNFEREADLSVLDTQGHPWYLINALEKVSLLSGNSRAQPNWHHFSIAQRVDFLQQAARRPGSGRLFSKKLNIKKMIFLLAAAFLSLSPSLLPVNSWKAAARENITKIYIERALKHYKYPDRVFEYRFSRHSIP